MDKKRLEWRVGLFVFIGLAVLGGLLLQFSRGTSLFRPTYNLYLVAKNVGGLKRNASVLMSGVQIGTVSDIELNPQGTNVTITLKIYRQYEIHKDARFLIEQSGFLGDQYVAVIPTRNEEGPWQENEHPKAEEPFNLQEIARSAAGFLQRIDETTSNLNNAIDDVRRLVLNQQTLTNLSDAVANIRLVSERALTTVDNLNGLVVSNRAPIGDALSNVVYFSEQLQAVATNLQGVITTNGVELTTSMKNIESSTVMLKSMLQDVQSGKGLAGSVLRNEQLATNVQTIAANLSITTSNLNQFGLWHILWHHEHEPPPKKPAQSPKGKSR
jgi:phospholipid/cholesterol/gamma-HCH transport system substrate-binding protein